jgi:hypothetical protein
MRVLFLSGMLAVLCISTVHAQNREASLDDYLSGVLSSYEIVRKAEKNKHQVPSYLHSLKRTKFRGKPDSLIRYKLARHL